MCKPPEWCIIKIAIRRDNHAKVQRQPGSTGRKTGKKRQAERIFIIALEVDDLHDLRSLFKRMVGEVLENGLEAELDDELGYGRQKGRARNVRRRK